MTPDDVIAACITLRNHKEALVEKHRAELAPVNDKLNKLFAWLQQHLQAAGLQNIKGRSGTAFLQKDISVKVKDWDVFFKWVVDNNCEAFLEHRAAKSVVQEFVAANDTLPPGIDMTTCIEARVRKS